jgi:hypothetical protein
MQFTNELNNLTYQQQEEINFQKIQFKDAIELQKYNYSRYIQDQELRIKYENYNQKMIHTNEKNDL